MTTTKKLIEALETARTILQKRRLIAREAGRRSEAQKWRDAESMLTVAIALEKAERNK